MPSIKYCHPHGGSKKSSDERGYTGPEICHGKSPPKSRSLSSVSQTSAPVEAAAAPVGERKRNGEIEILCSILGIFLHNNLLRLSNTGQLVSPPLFRLE